MKKRDKRVAEKATEVKKMLEEWAVAEAILKAGEQIRFSMWIQSVPIVVQETPVYKMKLWDFFTKQRLIDAHIEPRNNLARISKLWRWRKFEIEGITPQWARGFPRLETVPDLSALGSQGIIDQNRYFRMSPILIFTIRKILLHNGIPFT